MTFARQGYISIYRERDRYFFYTLKYNQAFQSSAFNALFFAIVAIMLSLSEDVRLLKREIVLV